MPYYAQIKDGIAVSLVESSGAISAPDMVRIDSLDLSLLGRTYDGQGWGAAAVPVATRYITPLAFMSRFTDAEAVAIDLASIGATAQAAGVRRYLNKVNVAKHIDLDRADTRAGVQALETATLLAPGRALQILDSPVTATERA